jgi:hypothetical protein
MKVMHWKEPNLCFPLEPHSFPNPILNFSPEQEGLKHSSKRLKGAESLIGKQTFNHQQRSLTSHIDSQ